MAFDSIENTPLALESPPTSMVTASTPGHDASIGPCEQQAEALQTPSSPSIALPKRRNGKPQSCEPCRKAKSACDHTIPKCHRCVRRGIADLCTYHPSPMTRIGNGRGAAVSKSQDRIKTGGALSNSAASAAASNLLLLLSQQRTLAVEDAEPETSHEYLGPTSYSAVIRESMSSFGPEIFTKEPENPDPRNRNLETAPENIHLCAEALLALPDQETCDRLLQRYFTYCDVILHEPSANYCLRALWSKWGETLRERDQTGLRAMAKHLLNTPRVVLRSCKTSAEWLESFTGKNFRIEMIGNFLAVFGLAAMTMSEWDPFFTSSQAAPAITRKQYVYKVGTGAETCVKLATANAAIASEPIVWLLHHAQILQSQYSGDENGYLWRKAGSVATAVTSLGLHREDATATSMVPFMVSELRKRIFAAVFIADKQLATFTGRPPRLSRRYSHCQLPLDLSDEQLMAEGDELAQHMRQLDSNGWSHHPVSPITTVERGFMLMALLRDEVLEVCLGPSSAVSPERRDELKQRCETTYNDMPDSIKFNIHDTSPPVAAGLCGRLLLRLEFLLHTFLLDRLPLTHDDEHATKQNLTNVSKTIIDHIIILAQYRDRLVDFSYPMTWAVTYFGLQSASILIIELLKQHQYPQQYTLVLPRSDIIQMLSVFLYCLDMVDPDEGNYTICVRVKKMIRRGLDKVLEHPAIDTDLLSTTPGGTRLPLPNVDMPTMMGPDNDEDFMEWLTSVDWSKGPWVDGF